MAQLALECQLPGKPEDRNGSIAALTVRFVAPLATSVSGPVAAFLCAADLPLECIPYRHTVYWPCCREATQRMRPRRLD